MSRCLLKKLNFFCLKGTTFPAVNTLLANWIPVHRSEVFRALSSFQA